MQLDMRRFLKELRICIAFVGLLGANVGKIWLMESEIEDVEAVDGHAGSICRSSDAEVVIPTPMSGKLNKL